MKQKKEEWIAALESPTYKQFQRLLSTMRKLWVMKTGQGSAFS